MGARDVIRITKCLRCVNFKSRSYDSTIAVDINYEVSPDANLGAVPLTYLAGKVDVAYE